ncbi:MAG: acyltransferase family protein [Muribaculaceae bacterium]|nr:acyltransferase family protein [Muribaculaceae bacterium]
MEAIKQQRIKYFDLLKGIAIFMVVMGHVLTMCIRGIDSAFLFKLISEIHMPIFFFISGYLTYKIGYQRPNITKRFKQLIIPFFVVSALWIWYFPYSHLESPISSNLIDMYFSYWKDGYWFTLCLFEMFLIYYPLSIILSKTKRLITHIVIVVLTYLALIVIANYTSFPEINKDIAGMGLLTSFFPVFMFGVLANCHKEKFATFTNSNKGFIIATALFIISWYYTVYFWEFPNIPLWGHFISQPLEHLGLIIIAIALITPWSEKEYSENKRPSVAARYFNYLGQESLSIYLLHYFFLFPLTMLQTPLIELGLPFVPLFTIASIVAFVIIGITLFASYTISRNSILSKLMIGK